MPLWDETSTGGDTNVFHSKEPSITDIKHPASTGGNKVTGTLGNLKAWLLSPVVLSTFCRADNNTLIIEDKPYKITGPKMSDTQLYFSITF